MAATTVVLKDNTFFTLDDVKDWLRVPLANTDHDNRILRLINSVTDMCEKYIEGPIKTRSFVEERSGDSSNTIVPTYWPIRAVTEIKIDYNRTFDATSIVDPVNYVLQGPPDVLEIAIKGQDVVLRDENSSSIIGRLFNGSVVGSIKMTYTAGWGDDQTEIPGDLSQAVMMGIEYFYMVRENRELNVTGKSTNGQEYRRKVGLPQEVTEILDSYKDYTFGGTNQPQRNRFSI